MVPSKLSLQRLPTNLSNRIWELVLDTILEIVALVSADASEPVCL